MSLAKPIEYEDASPAVRAVYDDIMATRKTDWIELLGFVMPKTLANPSLDATALASVSGVETVFRPGQRAEANEIMVRP